MNILFTVCGRAGSKGIKNKNCRMFLGRPISYYTLDVIKAFCDKHNEYNTTVALSTDSEDLVEQIRDFTGLTVEVVNRKESLAGDLVAKIDVVKDCCQTIEVRKNTIFDMIIDLDITSPLRTLDNLEELIEKKINSKCDIVFSVTEARRNPYFNMVMKKNGNYTRVLESNFNTRQEAPEIFDMNASLYAYDPQYLKTGKGIFEGQCEIIKMRDTGVLDLDREEDFDLMEIIATKFTF